MHTTASNFTVADYCQALDRNEITVNREYQRSEAVWPDTARSYLIETIILAFPVPKLSLYVKTDLRSRRTVREIVDGQQRSVAIRDFFHDKLRLSTELETARLSGRTYSELEDTDKEAFLGYSLNVDLFISATEQEVRDSFRRINSYTVPLNPEEMRHALYQGKFKWFINRMTSDFDELSRQAGLFNQRQLIRMTDAKLYTEICHALLNGITTTNSKALDNLYKARDQDFPEILKFDQRLRTAIEIFFNMEELHHSTLMKPFQAYALLLAITHVESPVPSLKAVWSAPVDLPSERNAVVNLSRLAEALRRNTDEAGDSKRTQEYKSYENFVNASESKTNVKAQRETRFIWFCRALTEIQI